MNERHIDNQSRTEFLIEMYRQMWENINRHILVVWQSVAALFGTFAVFAFVEKNLISMDVAAVIVLLACAWMLAHVYDANFWFNRNLAILTNIERQFLKEQDLHDIHPYFREHRNHTLVDHLLIQAWLGVSIAAVVLVYHFHERVWPGVGAPIENLELVRSFPYVTFAAAIAVTEKLRHKNKREYLRFAEDSPGIQVGGLK